MRRLNILKVFVAPLFALGLGACVQTTVQGYADRDLPPQGVKHIVAYVAGPLTVTTQMQARISAEASKRGIMAEDALQIFPPTRTYEAEEVRNELLARGVDGILIMNVGDTGVIKQYAGTVFSAEYNHLTGTTVATATRQQTLQRSTNFTAQLYDPITQRTLWTGQGVVNANGSGFVSDGIGPISAVQGIFRDLQSKHVIGGGT